MTPNPSPPSSPVRKRPRAYRPVRRFVRDTKRFPGTVRRWVTDRCAGCGHRFRWHEGRYATGNRDGLVFHDPCISLRMLRYKADERMAVLDLITDVWQITSSDVCELMGNRAETDGYERSNAWNLAWRVFYDLDNKRKAEAAAALAGGAS